MLPCLEFFCVLRAFKWGATYVAVLCVVAQPCSLRSVTSPIIISYLMK